jgi:hypothetical protein
VSLISVLDLNKVDITFMSVMILRSVVLSEEGGPAICCVLTMYLSYFAEMGATSTASGRLEVNLILLKKRG